MPFDADELPCTLPCAENGGSKPPPYGANADLPKKELFQNAKHFETAPYNKSMLIRAFCSYAEVKLLHALDLLTYIL